MPATVSVGDTHDTQETKQNVDEFFDAGIFARPAQLLWSCAMIVSASFGCVEFKLWQALMSHSTSATAVNHMVMTLSVMSSLSILTLKVYMESLRPTRFKDKVREGSGSAVHRNLFNLTTKIININSQLVYENFKTHTHLAIVLLLFSSLTFNIALWPKYGFLKTCAIAAMVGYGECSQAISMAKAADLDRTCSSAPRSSASRKPSHSPR